jgi:hypothetical protein
MFYVLLIGGLIGVLTSTGFTVIVLAAAPGYLRQRREALAQMHAQTGFTPPLTLLKPKQISRHSSGRIIPSTRFSSVRAIPMTQA